MFFSDSTKNRIKNSIPILEVIEYLGITHLKRVGNDYIICCPFHSEKTPSFHIYTKTNTCTCFGGCAKTFDVIEFYASVKKCDFVQACSDLLGVFLPNLDLSNESLHTTTTKPPKIAPKIVQTKTTSKEPYKVPKNEFSGLYSDFLELCVKLNTSATITEKKKVLAYLEGRNISKEIIKDFSLFAVHSEREILKGLKHYDLQTLKNSGLVNDYGNIVFKSHTLVIPYFIDNEIFTFQGRTIDKNAQKTPKYLFLKGAKSNQIFFNINELLHPKKENIVILEGVFDALTMCQYLREKNEKNTAVIACLGVNNFPLNSIPLFRAFKTVTLCFDNDFEKSDNVGQNKTLKLVNDFAKEGITVQAKQTPPPYKDFSEMYSKLLCKRPPPQKLSGNLEKMVNVNPNLGTLISKFNCKEF